MTVDPKGVRWTLNRFTHPLTGWFGCQTGSLNRKNPRKRQKFSFSIEIWQDARENPNFPEIRESNLMLLHSLKLQNLLSFGPDSPEVPLGPLNVLIGPNGSGKSNFIEAISLLQALPQSLLDAMRKVGSSPECFWKSTSQSKISSKFALLEVQFSLQSLLGGEISHQIIIQDRNSNGGIVVSREEMSCKSDSSTKTLFKSKIGSAEILEDTGFLDFEIKVLKNFNSQESVVYQIKDSYRFPDVTSIGENYKKIKIFREWSFGRQSPLRYPQPADSRNDFLNEDCLNLGLVLNQIRLNPTAKRQLLKGLQALYEGIEDFEVSVQGNTVQVFLQEGDITIPATRLSDGTLRYLCLLAILCHPAPPPLICIEEPELGLHPDLMPTLADLMRDASERTQIIATTHSDILVDALTETPDSILICEKHDGSTTLKRLNQEDLKVWLKDYSLGELWRSGQIGGNRW